MDRLDPDFRPLLRHHDFDALQMQYGTVFGVWPDFRLAYLNPAWFRFAAQNGGEPQITEHWGLGVSIFMEMPALIVSFYKQHYRECLSAQGVWSHLYECSSDRLFRLFYQTVYSLGDGDGLLISNSLVIEQAHNHSDRRACEADDPTYRDGQGFLHQCAHCRRVQNLTAPNRWDWIPEWVRQIPSSTSHTFCPACYGYYYPAGGIS